MPHLRLVVNNPCPRPADTVAAHNRIATTKLLAATKCDQCQETCGAGLQRIDEPNGARYVFCSITCALVYGESHGKIGECWPKLSFENFE